MSEEELENIKRDFRDGKTTTKEVYELLKGIKVFEDNISNFAFGCDQESECRIMDEDYKKFVKEATDVLYPLVKKYFQFNPEMTATIIGIYDLCKDTWEE